MQGWGEKLRACHLEELRMDSRVSAAEAMLSSRPSAHGHPWGSFSAPLLHSPPRQPAQACDRKPSQGCSPNLGPQPALPASGISSLVTSALAHHSTSPAWQVQNRALWKFKHKQDICIALNYPSPNVQQL